MGELGPSQSANVLLRSVAAVFLTVAISFPSHHAFAETRQSSCVKVISWKGTRHLTNRCRHPVSLVRWDSGRCLPGCLDTLDFRQSLRLEKRTQIRYFETCEKSSACTALLYSNRG